ncbi:MAG TPA: DUF2934 domain-containing protein [Candidatus Dormibacteraeota bacterium]|jgi:hypothetical protein|nr:DUF2934 domain-containing protein [Candidatus Dormibacteraeota bacterium]
MPKTKSVAAPKPKTTRAKKTKPTEEEIALRAYHIYLERNGAPGDPHSDWLRAEAELTASPKKSSRKSKVISIAA